MPLHYARTPSQGVVVYDGNEPIAQVTDGPHAETVAFALLLGQREIAGHRLTDRQRLGIAAECAALAAEKV